MFDLKKIIAGAISGFAAAFLTDLHAWSKSTPDGKPNASFDFGLAFKRWVGGGLSGATAAFGMSGVF